MTFKQPNALIVLSENLSGENRNRLPGFWHFQLDNCPDIEEFDMVSPGYFKILATLTPRPNTILVVIRPDGEGWIGPAIKCGFRTNGIKVSEILSWNDILKIIRQVPEAKIKF